MEAIKDNNLTNRVKVAIRLCPFIDKQNEPFGRRRSPIQIYENEIILENYMRFEFDKIFDDKSDQKEVFDFCSSELIE